MLIIKQLKSTRVTLFIFVAGLFNYVIHPFTPSNSNLKRATAHSKLADYLNSIEDCKNALKIDPTVKSLVCYFSI
jgi:hypothetical protein